jgi:flagellar hook-basal body complex protein FliE
MPAPISPIGISSPALAPVAAPGRSGQAGGFQAALGEAIGKVQAFQQNAQDNVNKALSGEGGELHNAALAVQRAELSFEMFLQVRNQVVSAYQEIMKTQL